MPLQSAPLRSLGSWPLGSGRLHYPATIGQGKVERKEKEKNTKGQLKKGSVSVKRKSAMTLLHSTRTIGHFSYTE